MRRAQRHIPAKVVRPRLAAVVRRPRLLKRLDGREPVAWVSAPPGAGKTTLVASWVEARRLPCAWVQLDAGDDDPASFFHYVGVAVRRLAPRARLPAFSPEYLPAIETFARRFFRALAGATRTPFVLVLDDCHDLPRGSACWDALRAGLPELSPSRAILVARGEPPPALARLRLVGAMRVVAPDELKLTRAESGALARLRGRRRLSTAEVTRLHAAADGWAAGLVLLLGGGEELPHRGRPKLLFDYFAGEVLSRAGRDARRLLAEIAVLPRITAAVAVRLVGTDDVASLLSDLADRGYFVAKGLGAEAMFNLHPLFREFLLDLLDHELPRERREALRREAGRLLAEEGELEDAVELLRQARDLEALARTIVAHAPALAADGRAATIARWLAALPAEELDRDPWLHYWAGATRLPGDPAAALPSFERAFHGFERASDPAGLYLAWAGIVDALFLAWDDFAPFDRWIAAFEALRRRHPPPPEHEDRVAVAIFTALAYRQPTHPDLPAWEERILPLATGPRDARLGRTAYALAQYWFNQGDLSRAGGLVDALQRNAAAADPLTRLGWLVTEAHLAFLRGDPDAALGRCGDALDAARALRLDVWNAVTHALAVLASLHLGDVPAAAAHLRRMARETDPTRRLHAAYLQHLTSMVAARRGEHVAERAAAEAALRGASEAGVPFAVAWCEVGVAIALAHAGELDGAEAHAERAARGAVAQRSRRIELGAALALAEIAGLRGDQDALRGALARALRIVRETGVCDHSWASLEQMARWCAAAIRAGIEVETARRLVVRRRLPSVGEAEGLAAWPWPIRVRLDGRPSLEREGEPVRFARKIQKKPFELLRALVDAGGELSREQAEAELWPDAEGDAAHRALDVTLLRLRRLLGREDAIALRARTLRLDRRLVWVERG